MADTTLTPTEVLILVVLMAEADEVSNPVLKERYGVTLTGKSCKKLNELKLVESRKGERGALFHLLSDHGWRHLGELVAMGTGNGAEEGVRAPQRSGWAGAGCLALLGGLQRYLVRHDKRFADIFESPSAPVEPAPAPRATVENAENAGSAGSAEVAASPAPSTATVTLTPADVQARVRAAYVELAREPGDWVSLTRVRERLADVARADVDATLESMIELPDVNIVPASNQKALTGADRAAAVRIGNEDKHLIWIGVR
jgi:hypothetical protein